MLNLRGNDVDIRVGLATVEIFLFVVRPFCKQNIYIISIPFYTIKPYNFYDVYERLYRNYTYYIINIIIQYTV